MPLTTLYESRSGILPTLVLPNLYGKWISQLLEDSIPAEQAATCDSCAMCFHENSGSERQAFYFNPAIKCCTYAPELPNFIVGAILADLNDDMAVGRKSVQQRLTAGVGVTPLGVSPSPNFTLLYRNSPAAFGRSQTLSCPHYMAETGCCGIWQYRTPTCFTWFCKHNHGAVGHNFWQELHLLLLAIQQNVALWSMAKLGIDTKTMRALLNQPQRIDAESNISGDILDGKVDESWQRSVWGNWYGREEECYQRCADFAKELDWRDVAVVCGAEVQIRAQIVKATHHKLIAHALPTRLHTGNFQVVNISEDHVRVTTYSPYDPLDIPKQILEALSYFDGRPLAEALDVISRQKDIPLNSQMLHTLLDFGILVGEGSNTKK